VLGGEHVLTQIGVLVLLQMYSMASGAKALASRVRPQLMENNLCDCVRIAEAAHASIVSGTEQSINYY
jgi:hypothetical protein